MEKMYKAPLGEILIEMGALTAEQLESALEEQRRSQTRLGQTLITLEYVTEEQITEARALQLDFAYVDLKDYEFSPSVVAMVPETLARAYKLIPVARSGDRLTLAMANPMDIEAIDLIRFETKCHVEPALATDWRIAMAIEREYGACSAEELQEYMDQASSDLEIAESDMGDELSEDINEVRRLSDRAPIIRMVNYIVTQAVRQNASDIHIEPKRNGVDVRYRIDGELRQMKGIPKHLKAAVTSRIKIMSELDISERRLPQDGRITVRVDGRPIDLRVSTNPTVHGERIVLRLLDRSQGLIPLNSLGFSSKDMHLFTGLINKPYGIMLVTGPTGSGKTTTLYAALNDLKSERTNILTVEDPVEYELDGIGQTMVHSRIGVTFASYLRTILRQDPDIILVGEIRDAETADIAFRAALTGHLVLSTLHANDAPGAVTRLLDMGVEPFLVSSAIIGIQAQRLVRVLCNTCKEAYTPEDDIREMLCLSKGVTLYRAVGCGECGNTGYKGRTTVLEIMPINEELRRLALHKASSDQIRQAALKAGMVDINRNAMQKIVDGVTSVDEIQRKMLFDLDLLSEDLTSPRSKCQVA